MMIKKSPIKRLVTFSLVCCFAQTATGQVNSQLEKIVAYFNEIESATEKYSGLWGKDLYAPILLVDRQTRRVFANEPDTSGVLKPNGNIYSGVFPKTMNVANTALEWGGKRWAMIMLPLPENSQSRINLMGHELFHRAQPSLGLAIRKAAGNNHLGQKEGRIYLRLELEALKKAVQSTSPKDQHIHISNALIFRKYRHSIYAGSDDAENTLELNEGLAEFTGAIISGRNEKQMEEHFVNSIHGFLDNPTFVRSFAYETTPIYGYLLYQNDKNWTKEITLKTNLTHYFINAFHIDLPTDLVKAAERLAGEYNGKTIIAEESARAVKNKKQLAAYRKKFINQPHFELPILIDLQKLSVAFDPRTIVPLGDKGTVYPNIRVTDLWGILTVEKGALISPGWGKISLTNPVKTDGKKITGDGWVLDLTDGFSVEKDEKSGSYILKKIEKE